MSLCNKESYFLPATTWDPWKTFPFFFRTVRVNEYVPSTWKLHTSTLDETASLCKRILIDTRRLVERIQASWIQWKSGRLAHGFFPFEHSLVKSHETISPPPPPSRQYFLSCPGFQFHPRVFHNFNISLYLLSAQYGCRRSQYLVVKTKWNKLIQDFSWKRNSLLPLPIHS